MAQNTQTLPSIAHLTNDLPPQDPNRLSQNTDVRDSGNWSISQSKHSSTISTSNGLPLHNILNTDDSPARGPGSVPETPISGRPMQHGGPQEPGKWETGQFESPPANKPLFPPVTRGFDGHQGPARPNLDTPSITDSRRSSVDSRMNSTFNHLAISPTSPYDSNNLSRGSLVSNLQQQRGIPDTRVNGSAPPTSPLSGRFDQRPGSSGLGPAPRRAPVINPNPRSVSGMPDPTAAAPTKGFPWAFPDSSMVEQRRRSTSDDSSMDGEGRSIPSRQNSFATSVNSSLFTTESGLPPGQKRFEEADLQTHHHSMQHRAVTNLQADSHGGASGNYSRTPELRVSHKMAERKRRSEMKGLFDELNSILPNTPGGKSSKWEVLTKAIEHIKQLKHSDAALRRDHERLNHDAGVSYTLENENKNLRGELTSCWQHLQRLEPNNHHVFGSYTNHLTMEAQQQQQQSTQPLPPQQPLQQQPPPAQPNQQPPPQQQPSVVRLPSLTSNVPPPSLPPQFGAATNGAAPAPMEGVATQY